MDETSFFFIMPSDVLKLLFKKAIWLLSTDKI